MPLKAHPDRGGPAKRSRSSASTRCSAITLRGGEVARHATDRVARDVLHSAEQELAFRNQELTPSLICDHTESSVPALVQFPRTRYIDANAEVQETRSPALPSPSWLLVKVPG